MEAAHLGWNQTQYRMTRQLVLVLVLALDSSPITSSIESADGCESAESELELEQAEKNTTLHSSAIEIRRRCKGLGFSDCIVFPRAMLGIADRFANETLAK